MKKYSEKLWQLRQEIIADIKDILLANDNRVNIPFFYDEDEIDDDIETLIEDEYNVQVGKDSDNLLIYTENYCGYRSHIYVVAIHLEKNGNILITTKRSNIVYIEDIHDLHDLINLYEALVKETGN